MKRVCYLMALLTLLTACGGDKVNDTLLVVNVTLADLVAGTDVDRIVIDATPSQGAAAQRVFTVDSSTTFPITLGLVPVGPSTLNVAVNVTASKGGVPVVAQAADVATVPNQAKQLTVVLERVCAMKACGSGSTCRAGACVLSTVFANELQPYPSVAIDAGVVADGSVPPDGSSEPPDAAIDASVSPPVEGKWNRVDVSLAAANQAMMNFTSFTIVEGGDLIIVGSLGAQGIAVRGSGSTFERITLPPGTPSLYSVWASGRNNIWAVGAQGTIVHGTSSGFATVPSGTTDVLASVFGFGNGDTWAVGTNATILHETGGTWQRVPAPAVQGSLYSISGSAADDLWAVGSDGGVFRNNGADWKRVDQMLTRNVLYSVWAVSALDVWVVGDRISLHWDGKRFAAVNIPLDTALGVWGTASNDVWAVGRPAAGGSPIARWTGTEWTSFASPVASSLQSVRGTSAKDVGAVGNTGVLTRFAPLQ